jgi:hypothetical protein
MLRIFPYRAQKNVSYSRNVMRQAGWYIKDIGKNTMIEIKKISKILT